MGDFEVAKSIVNNKPWVFGHTFTRQYIVEAQDHIYDFLKNAGSPDMRVAGSLGTPINFDFTPATGKAVIVERCVSVLLDAGMAALEFANLAALTNGVRIIVLDTDGTTEVKDYTPEPIKNNSHWSYLAGVDGKIENATGVDALPVRWTLSRSGGALLLKNGQTLRVIIQDDLSAGIDEFKMIVHGTQHDAFSIAG